MCKWILDSHSTSRKAMPDEPKPIEIEPSSIGMGIVYDPSAPPVDFEEIGRQYLADAKKRDAIARYEADSQKGYPESDWDHAMLRPYRHAIDQVRDWQYGPMGVIASGKTGRGKTRAIFDLYRRLACEEGRSVRYWFAGDWFSELQSNVKYGRDDARGWIEAVAKHPIVILDDLGQEAVTTARSDWAAGWFFRFLDIRIAARLPLIVSTNLTAQEIAGSHAKNIRSEPMIRRLLELGAVVKFDKRLI